MNNHEYELIGESIWNTYSDMAYIIAEGERWEKVKRGAAITALGAGVVLGGHHMRGKAKPVIPGINAPGQVTRSVGTPGRTVKVGVDLHKGLRRFLPRRAQRVAGMKDLGGRAERISQGAANIQKTMDQDPLFNQKDNTKPRSKK